MKGIYIHILAFTALFLKLSDVLAQEFKRNDITGYTQGTTYSIIQYTTGKAVEQREIDSVLKVIDLSMSIYIPNSTISKFNEYSTDEIILDEHFRKVVETSFEIYKDSKGIFDLTVQPLVQMWGFGAKKITALPTKKQIDSVRQYVGMDKLKLEGNKLIKLKKGIKVDVNGIAQGYSVDVLADYLEAKGVNAYLVEVGGELRIKGPKPDGEPFKIGVEKPMEGIGMQQQDMQEIIAINKGAVTTAGNYRKYQKSKDKKISHHIDPKTGYPYQGQIISATVYTEKALMADGYDNVFMAMTPAKAIKYANKRNMQLYLIYRDKHGKVLTKYTDGFLQLDKPQT